MPFMSTVCLTDLVWQDFTLRWAHGSAKVWGVTHILLLPLIESTYQREEGRSRSGAACRLGDAVPLGASLSRGLHRLCLCFISQSGFSQGGGGFWGTFDRRSHCEALGDTEETSTNYCSFCLALEIPAWPLCYPFWYKCSPAPKLLLLSSYSISFPSHHLSSSQGWRPRSLKPKEKAPVWRQLTGSLIGEDRSHFQATRVPDVALNSPEVRLSRELTHRNPTAHSPKLSPDLH